MQWMIPICTNILKSQEDTEKLKQAIAEKQGIDGQRSKGETKIISRSSWRQKGKMLTWFIMKMPIYGDGHLLLKLISDSG